MSPTRSALLVHVGYSKTGTTWLQQRLFASDAPGSFRPQLDRSEIIDLLVAPSDLDFDPDATRATLSARLESCGADVAPVLSHERLIGNPHSGGYDQVALADRLSASLTDPRILITIREQRSMLVSLYQQYVKVGGACRMIDYCLPPDDHRLPLFGLGYLDYDRTVALYQDRFGADAVLVLPYEQLRRDPGSFVAAICRHAGTAPPSELTHDEELNAAWSPSLVAMLRWANAVGRRTDSAINPRAGILRVDRGTQRRLRALDRRLPGGVAARVAARQEQLAERLCSGRFAASNRRTAALTGLDLASYGYEV